MALERNILKIGDSSVKLEFGVKNIRDRLADPEHYKGPNDFDVVVNFGQLFVDLQMRGGRVPDHEQWFLDNPPPPEIEILDFEYPHLVRASLDTLANIASEDFYWDPHKCEAYYEATQQILSWAYTFSGVDDENSQFLGLLRAGAVAGSMLNYEVEDQVLIQTKRLALRGDRQGDIAIGVSYLEPEKARGLHGKDLVIADPAGATNGSVVANIAYLVSEGIKPRSVTILNTVTSQRGAEFALRAIKGMGIDVEIIAGGCSYQLDDKYYLMTKEGGPAVRDAGDALNRYLPPKYQL